MNTLEQARKFDALKYSESLTEALAFLKEKISSGVEARIVKEDGIKEWFSYTKKKWCSARYVRYVVFFKMV